MPAAAKDESLPPITTKVWQEVTISVHNLERTGRFFTQVAGYTERWRGVLSQSELQFYDLPENARAEALLLGHDDHESALVRLIRFDNVGPKSLMRPGARAWDTGCYFSVMVRAKNLSDLYQRAIELGWSTETPITPLSFGQSKLNVVIFKGPDGVQVQAYERLAPALPKEIGEFEKMSRPFNIMQMVKDRDRSFEFLTTVLGFQAWFAGPPYKASEPEFNPIGIPYSLTTSVSYHAAIVYPVKGEFGRMEIIDIPEIHGRDHSQRCAAPNVGILSVRFEVPDIEKAKQMVVNRSWPIKQDITSVDLKPYGELKLFSIQSPDGAIVTFYQKSGVYQQSK